MADIRIVPKADAASWMHSLHSAKPSMALGLLLAGDRWLCVDEVALATIDGEIVGIATIAPEGEMRDGEPTIVAIYVLHEHRASGVGYELLEATVDYMSSKGLVPIRVDVMNSKVSRMIGRLPGREAAETLCRGSVDGWCDRRDAGDVTETKLTLCEHEQRRRQWNEKGNPNCCNPNIEQSTK